VSSPPSVIVHDGSSNPVQGVTVTFAPAAGSGSVTGGTQTTNGSGIATVGSWTLSTTAGTNTLTATSSGLTGSRDASRRGRGRGAEQRHRYHRIERLRHLHRAHADRHGGELHAELRRDGAYAGHGGDHAERRDGGGDCGQQPDDAVGTGGERGRFAAVRDRAG